MNYFPLVDRELRVAGRQRWTFWGRTLSALAATATIALISWFARREAPAQLAMTLFGTLTFLCFGFTLLAGAFFSADSLARERREGTLGLLLLTDLRGFDIALGKLAATSLRSFYCLLAVIPVLAIPLLLGGITGLQYARVVLVLLITLWAALTTGLLASTFTRSGLGSAVAAALLMLGLSVLGPLGGLALEALPPSWGVGSALGWRRGFYLASPFAAYFEAMDPTPGRPAVGTWAIPLTKRFLAALGFTAASGVLALLFALRRLPRLGLETGDPTRSRSKSREAAHPSVPTQRALAGNPIAWLSNRLGPQRRVAWWILGGATALWWVLRGCFGPEWNTFAGWVATSLALHFLLQLWLAAEAPRVFHAERNSGGIELLLTTGLNESDFVTGRIQALRRLAWPPLTIVSIIDWIALLFSLSETRADPQMYLLVLNFWLGRTLLLWLDAEALAWTGTWLSVATRGQRVAAATWVRVILLPHAVCLAALLILVATFGLDFRAFTWVVLAIHVGLSITRCVVARRRLQNGFRARAAVPLGAGV